MYYCISNILYALQDATIAGLILSKLFQLLTEISLTAMSWSLVKVNLLCFTFKYVQCRHTFIFLKFGVGTKFKITLYACVFIYATMYKCQNTCIEINFFMRKFASEVCFHKGKCFIVGFFLFYGEVLQAATMKLSV